MSGANICLAPRGAPARWTPAAIVRRRSALVLPFELLDPLLDDVGDEAPTRVGHWGEPQEHGAKRGGIGLDPRERQQIGDLQWRERPAGLGGRALLVDAQLPFALVDDGLELAKPVVAGIELGGQMADLLELVDPGHGPDGVDEKVIAALIARGVSHGRGVRATYP